VRRLDDRSRSIARYEDVDAIATGRAVVPYGEDIRAVTEIPDVKNGAPEKTEERKRSIPACSLRVLPL